jgi:hypothetical protein
MVPQHLYARYRFASQLARQTGCSVAIIDGKVYLITAISKQRVLVL